MGPEIPQDGDSVIPADDDETGEHAKTVYAHFGAAVYFAQCLEHGLVNALVYVDLIPNPPRPIRTREEWASAVDGFMDRHFERTLGQMIADLRRVTGVPDELASRLGTALKTRNWLVHDYFRERATEWFTREGRERMIAELEECRKSLLEADRLLDATFEPVREKHGFTDERLQQAYEEMLSQVQPDRA